MSPCRFVLSALLGGILFVPALGQNPPIVTPPQRGPNNRPTTPPNRQRKEPCWEVAGIPKAAMEQHHRISEEARQQVEAVCANPSLTMAQKRQEIRGIHEREKQQLEALITPQQREAMKACQEERGHGGHGGGGFGGGHGAGPCGEMPPSRKTTPPSRED